jgi:hypothetical protein
MRQSVNEVIIFVFPSPLELKPGRPPLPAGPHQCTKHINHTSKGKESHADDKDLPCAAISNRPRSAAPVFHGKGNCQNSAAAGCAAVWPLMGRSSSSFLLSDYNNCKP